LLLTTVVFLLRITRAAITPGIHPQQVSIVTISTDPHPLSSTASGGKIIDNITLKQLILLSSQLLILKFHSSINLQIPCQISPFCPIDPDFGAELWKTNIFSFIN